MIYTLSGTISMLEEDFAVMDVSGVGYQLFASGRTLGKLAKGEAAQVFVYTHVREDHIHLYAFHNEEERAWFNKLLDVSGVGAKVALALLSALSPDDMAHAIRMEQPGQLTQANGVGKKLAERIILEMKGKVPNVVSMGSGADGAQITATAGSASRGVQGDVLSALTNMGFKAGEANAAIANATKEQGDTPEFGPLLKASLQTLKGDR